MTLEELKAKAKGLNIQFEDSVTEDDLNKKVQEAEDKNSKDPEYLKNEAKKAFDERDKAKKAKREAEAEIKKLKDQMSNTVNKDDYEDLRKQLGELRQKELEREEAEEAVKLEKASEVDKIKLMAEKEKEKLKREFDERLKKLEKSIEDNKAEREKILESNKSLRHKTLETEILIAAEKNNAIKPSQIVKLLKGDFEWDEDLGKYVVVERDSKGKSKDYHEVDTYVEAFLKKEENDNLVKSELNTNSFQSPRGDNPGKIKTDKDYKPSGKYDPKNPKLIEDANRAGMSVEKWIQVKELRDKRFEPKK